MNLADTIAEREIERVTAYALRHRFTLEQVREIAGGTRASCRTNPCYVANLPMGMTAVYSIEEHPGGWYNKVFISVGGAMPIRKVAIAMAIHISRPHGPRKLEKADDALVYAEPDGTGINVLIPFVEPAIVVTQE